MGKLAAADPGWLGGGRSKSSPSLQGPVKGSGWTPRQLLAPGSSGLRSSGKEKGGWERDKAQINWVPHRQLTKQAGDYSSEKKSSSVLKGLSIPLCSVIWGLSVYRQPFHQLYRFRKRWNVLQLVQHSRGKRVIPGKVA